ncbi:MAG TPA: copper-binding protein [Bryobacteraceae bacterium]|nr:copper-binding protein [Bryobacteraceae bacterium]
MKRLGMRFLAALAVACLLAASAFAQSNSKKKSYTLHGVIQAVKGSEKKVTVKHDKIEGYMGAMTMDYKVADDAMLKKLKAGDEITATLYQDDYTLYDIRLTQIDDRVYPK